MTLDFVTLLAGATLAGASLWKTGCVDSLAGWLGSRAGHFGAWVTSEDGAWASLPEQLPYRDFYADVVETRDGWLWTGLELRPVPTDGFSGRDWNLSGVRLNRVIAGLPDKTWLQTITYISDRADEPSVVFERLAACTPDPVWQTVVRARADHLRCEAARGRVRDARTFAFIGRKSQPRILRVPLRGIWSSKSFVDLEHKEFLALRDDVLRARDTFSAAFKAAGGASRPIPARVAFELAYTRLNPERAAVHSAPAYETMPIFGVDSVNSESDILRRDSCRSMSDPQRNGLIGTRPYGSDVADFAKRARTSFVEMNALREDLFTENPRETLCFTDVEVKEDYFLFNSVPCTTLSLQRLPKKVFSGLTETLTRSAEIDFPLEVSTHFELGNWVEWDEYFERKQSRLKVNLKQAGNNPNQDEELKDEQITDLRRQLRVGEEKIGEVGIGITFSAPTVAELHRRRDRILVHLRAMEGMEGVAERHSGLDLHLATLPCAPHGDFRRKPCMTRDAVALSTLTGGPQGVSPEEAVDVYQRADQGLFFWNPASRRFKSGMFVICGASGSGKSGYANRQRTLLLTTGRRGVTLDYGGSSYRVCTASGGNHIDITNPSRSSGLGLFSIRPRPDEEYERDELTEEGLPHDRLAELEAMLELLCLDPTKPQETALEPELADYLRVALRRTYANWVDETPIVDDLIMTLRQARTSDKARADQLIARLNIFAKQGSLGRFLNDRSSEPLPVDAPYTVFDFGAAKDDPRLMLVASLAVRNYVGRFLRARRDIPKFVDIDEFHEVSQYPLIRRAADGVIRTARKSNALCGVISQSALDFDHDDVRGILSSAEVKWLFAMPNTGRAAKVLELGAGATRLLDSLQEQEDEEYRDCVLIYPPRGTVHLRLRNGALDRRLLLGGPRERATAEEALSGLSEPIHPRLIAALEADPHGATVERSVHQLLSANG